MISFYILLELMGRLLNGKLVKTDKIENGYVKNGIKTIANIHQLYLKKILNQY